MYAALLTIALSSAPVSGFDARLPEGVNPLSAVETPTGRTVVGTVDDGVWVSSNGTDFQPSTLSPLLADGSYAPIVELKSTGGDSFLAVDRHARLFRTDDAGFTWQRSDQGLPVPLTWSVGGLDLVADPADGDTIYTVISRPFHTERRDTLLYRSVDGGRTWQTLKEIPEAENYRELRVERLGGVATVVIETEHGGTIRIADRFRRDRHAVAHHLPPTNTPERLRGARSNLVTPADFDMDVDGDMTEDIAIVFDDGTLVAINDLDGYFAPDSTLVRYTPDGAPGLYFAGWQVPAGPIVASGIDLETDAIPLADESPVAKTLPWDFEFYGTTYVGGTDAIWISDNGNVYFDIPCLGGLPVVDTVETASALSNGPPRLAVMWDDLNPDDFNNGGGTVWYDDTAAQVSCPANPLAMCDRIIITWENVPEFVVGPPIPTGSSFQLVLYSDDSFDMVYGSLAMVDGLTGVSPGDADCGAGPGLPADLNFFDVSADVPLQLVANEANYEWYSQEFFTDRVARQFLSCHEDAYDQLMIWGGYNYPYNVAGQDLALAFAKVIGNDVQGIGLCTDTFPPCDTTAEHGSLSGRLKNVAVMGHLGDYQDPESRPPNPANPAFPPLTAPWPIGCEMVPLDVVGQQTARRWAAYVDACDPADPVACQTVDIRGRVDSHWSFFLDTEGSIMEGCDWFETVPPVPPAAGEYDCVAAQDVYSTLDLYLMGLLDQTAVMPFSLIDDPDAPGVGCTGECGNCGDFILCSESSPPQFACVPDIGDGMGGTTVGPLALNVNEVIRWAGGARMPGPNPGGTTITQAWILVVPPGDPAPVASDQDPIHVNDYRTAWVAQFPNLTGNLGTIDTTLLYLPQPDRPIGNSVRAVHQLYRHIAMLWRDEAASFPRRYAIHSAATKEELCDDSQTGVTMDLCPPDAATMVARADGIGSVAAIDFTGIEKFVDLDGVTTRPPTYFYEVHYRDCAQMTVFP